MNRVSVKGSGSASRANESQHAIVCWLKHKVQWSLGL